MNPPQPDITRTIEEILDEFAKWTINNVEHGIYIPLPSPEAVQKLVTLVNEARQVVINEVLSLDGLQDEPIEYGEGLTYNQRMQIKTRNRLRATIKQQLEGLNGGGK